jgi:hypothetical protein
MTHQEYQRKASAIVATIMDAMLSYDLSQPALNTIRKVLYGQLDSKFKEKIVDDKTNTKS